MRKAPRTPGCSYNNAFATQLCGFEVVARKMLSDSIFQYCFKADEAYQSQVGIAYQLKPLYNRDLENQCFVHTLCMLFEVRT